MLKVPSVLGVLAPNRVTCTVQVNVPCLAGVPPTIVPAAPKVAGIDRPGGSLPEVIVKVSTAPLLVSRNPSYGWPTVAAGNTQSPLTRVPLLVDGEHSKVIEVDWASAGPAPAGTASSAPAAAIVISVFLIVPLWPPCPRQSGRRCELSATCKGWPVQARSLVSY